MIEGKKYMQLIVLHIVIGFAFYAFTFLSKALFLSVVVYFLVRIFQAPLEQKTKEILLACSYIIAAEVLFRMTGGAFLYESGKYIVILYVLIGMFYSGISTKSFPYFIYLILFVPGIIVASNTLGYDLDFRKSVTFVLSGPVCLGIAAMFSMDKILSKEDLIDLVLYMSLPVLSMAVYLFFYTPNLRDVLSGTGSNFAASGGFGPNQVSTILGIGMFAFTVRFFLKSPTLFLKLLNGLILGFISYRGIVTFSRGGVFTAIIMILAFLYVVYRHSTFRQKRNLTFTVLLLIAVGSLTWFASSFQTDGLIEKRYTNKDAAGREKDDVSTGRVDIFTGELEGFFEHPFFGVGASGMKQKRLEAEGTITASHNEVSRLLSEHGLFGILALLILFLTPLFFRLQNKSNFLFYSFFCFWFATINHSAMRIAAPAFIYGLTLLNITYENDSIHREPEA